MVGLGKFAVEILTRMLFKAPSFESLGELQLDIFRIFGLTLGLLGAAHLYGQSEGSFGFGHEGSQRDITSPYPPGFPDPLNAEDSSLSGSANRYRPNSPHDFAVVIPLTNLTAKPNLREHFKFEVTEVVGHLGFTNSRYANEVNLEQRLRTQIAERDPGALHVVFYSEYGLASKLTDPLFREHFFRANKPPHGRILLIVDESKLNFSTITGLEMLADAIITVPTHNHTSLEEAFAEVMTFAAESSLPTTILMKEGGHSAATALSNTLHNVRFAEIQEYLSVIFETNFFPETPSDEKGRMAVTEILASWGYLEPYFHNVKYEIEYNDLRPPTETLNNNSLLSHSVSFEDPRITQLISELNDGMLVPSVFSQYWRNEGVRFTMSLEGDGNLNGTLNFKKIFFSEEEKREIRVTVQLEDSRRQTELSLAEMNILPSSNGSEFTFDLRSALGDFYAQEYIEINVYIARPSTHTSWSKLTSEKNRIYLRSSTQRSHRNTAAHSWKLGLLYALRREVRQLINDKKPGNEKPHPIKPLAHDKKPIDHYPDVGTAKVNLTSLIYELSLELMDLDTRRSCEDGFSGKNNFLPRLIQP